MDKIKHIIILLCLYISAGAQLGAPAIAGGGNSGSGGSGGGDSIWTESAGKVYPNNNAWNVGIGTTSPNYKLQVAGSVFFEKTVSGRTVHFAIDTIDGLMQSLWEWTNGDTSNVMGITPGDAFMRANSDGSDYDVIMNISDPGGVKIQGKSTTTGNALTILEGDTTIFGGDTLARFGNNGDWQYYKNPCAGCPLGDDGAGAGKVIYQPSGWRYINDSLTAYIHNNDSIRVGLIAPGIGGITSDTNFIFGQFPESYLTVTSNGFFFGKDSVLIAAFQRSDNMNETGLIIAIDTAGYSQVTLGAPNSGGAGYRVLRVPN